jgi:hypothetical protein
VAKTLDFDILLEFEEDNLQDIPGEREMELVSAFLSDILKDFLIMQALNQED